MPGRLLNQQKMPVKLRPRQQKAFDKAREAIAGGAKNIMLVGPPGTGKATIISAMTAAHVAKGGRVFQWVHKRELVQELSSRLKKQFNCPSGLILAGQPEQKDLPVQIASVMTVIRRNPEEWFFPTLLISDEAHRRLTGSQDAVHDKFPDAPLISFTATPVRADKKRKFSDVYDVLIQFSTYREEMADKYLVPTKVIAPKGIASMDGVKIRKVFGESDYDTKEMSDRYSDERLYASLLSEWSKHTGRRMQTMVFNVDKRHNKEVCEFFRKHGVNAEYVDESTPTKERDRIVAKFKAGPFVDDPIMVLCNIGVFTEGVDAEYTKCVILNYATKSFSRYIQSTARGSRPVWQDASQEDWLKINGKYYKDKLIVIDCGANWSRHGMLEDYDSFGFSLDEVKPPGEAPVKNCPECDTVIYASIMTCPECGHIFPPPKKVDEKPMGDEVEWGEVAKDQALTKKIVNLKKREAERAGTEWLRIVALVKGYDLRWVYKRIEERAEYGQAEFDKYPVFWDWLTAKEIEKGTHSIYQRLKSKRIAI